MKVLTHAEDCTDPRSDDPLECPCAGDYAHFRTLDDVLLDGFTFSCGWCGREITYDNSDVFFGDDDDIITPIAILHPWEEIQQVFCCPEHKTRWISDPWNKPVG